MENDLNQNVTPFPKMPRFLTGNELKLIAVISMIFDHIGVVLVERYILNLTYATEVFDHWYQIDRILRGVGRIAFPIYCFLLVEGFQYTRSRKAYRNRLLLMALLSEIPFDLMLGQFFSFEHQNIFWTLILGFIGMELLEKIKDTNDMTGFLKEGIIILCICGLGYLLRVDYGGLGVFAILAFYLLRWNRNLQSYMLGFLFFYELPAVLAVIPIQLYNGKRGKAGYKYLFYVVYPLHMLILVMIRFGLMNI